MIKFDLREFERAARAMDAFASQIPFALAVALNRSAEVARKELADTTWAQHITVRNPNFLKAALSTAGTRATKRSLRVDLYDRLARGSLLLHAEGGTKTARGANIAVPNKANLQPRRGSKGVPKGLRPRTLPNSFVKQSKYGPVVFQRTGKYVKGKPATKRSPARPGQDNRHLKAMYGLQPSAQIRADVPFEADFERIMRREMSSQFDVAMRKAMLTAMRR